MTINNDNDNVGISISTVPVFVVGTVFKAAGSGTGCHWDVVNCKSQNAEKMSKREPRQSKCSKSPDACVKLDAFCKNPSTFWH